MQRGYSKVSWVEYSLQDASYVAIAKVEFGSCPETMNLKLLIILHSWYYGTQWKWWSTVTAPKCPHLTGASFYDYAMVGMEFIAITHDFSVFWNYILSPCCCSVGKSCLTLCNPMDCRPSGFLVLHYLQKLAQTHVHWVGDLIQPSPTVLH